MGLSIISDIHIKKRRDSGYELLLAFLRHKKVQEGQGVYLLGDIFDFMCGGHEEYMDEYPEFFTAIKDLLKRKKVIHYLEGNHDFYLSGLFRSFAERSGLDKGLLHCGQGGVFKVIWNKRYYFTHGDEIELGNPSYKAYRKLMGLPVVDLLINKVVSYSMLRQIGERASSLSRNRNSVKQYDYSSLRDSYRKGVLELGKKLRPNFIIGGHSHIRDDFTYEGPDLTFRYLNNGMAMETKSFIHLDHNHVEFILL